MLADLSWREERSEGGGAKQRKSAEATHLSRREDVALVLDRSRAQEDLCGGRSR